MVLEDDKNIPEISFACLAINLYYSLFNKLLQSFSSYLQVSNNAGHYNWYGKLVKGLCKDFNQDYNKKMDNIDYKENAGDKKNDAIIKENNKKDSKNSLRDLEDNGKVGEKNRRESEVNNNNNLLLDPNLNTSVNVIAQLNLDAIVSL